MAKKLTKPLLSIALCAVLAVGAAAVTSYAANDPRTCPHNYQLLDLWHYEYQYMNPEQHRVTGWEQYYCMDCYSYSNPTPVNKTEAHTLPCSDCGHQ